MLPLASLRLGRCRVAQASNYMALALVYTFVLILQTVLALVDILLRLRPNKLKLFVTRMCLALVYILALIPQTMLALVNIPTGGSVACGSDPLL